jgi:hypothetical protein
MTLSPRWRITWKLLWMMGLVGVLVLLQQVRHDFVYQAF